MTEEPPSPANIIEALKEQQKQRITDYFSGKLQNKATEAFVIAVQSVRGI
ncbi:hypothetical protein [Siminovitchia sp. FSL W7-1587]